MYYIAHVSDRALNGDQEVVGPTGLVVTISRFDRVHPTGRAYQIVEVEVWLDNKEEEDDIEVYPGTDSDDHLLSWESAYLLAKKARFKTDIKFMSWIQARWPQYTFRLEE